MHQTAGIEELPFIQSLRVNGHIPLADALRNLVSDYPISHRPAIKARLHSDDGNVDMAALLEVAANRVLNRAGFTIDAVEPDLSAQGLKGKPDFLATHASCGQTIVEVRAASTADEQVKFEDRTVSEVMEGLNRHLVPVRWRFSVGVIARQGGGIPFAALAKIICERMAKFEADKVKPEAFRIDCPTVSLQLAPTQGTPGRVSIWSGGWARDSFAELTIVERLRKVLGQKGSKYGTPSQPMVLIVGLDSYMATGHDEVLSSLIGRQTLNLTRRSDGTAVTWAGRDTSGLFGTDVSPQFTRLSGILFVGEWNLQGLAGQFIQPKWESQKPWALYVTNPHATWPALDLFAKLPACLLSLAPGGGIAQNWRGGKDIVDFMLK